MQANRGTYRVEHIPAILAQGSEGPLRKKDIVRITGNLLKIRQYLYLNDENLIDMPEMFWSSPELEGRSHMTILPSSS